MNASTVFRASLISILGVAVVGSTIALVRRGDEYAFFDPLVDVKTLISKRYVENLPAEKVESLQAAAISGMVDALGDPYTIYVPAKETREFNKDLLGEYVGIGASVMVRDGVLTIESPLEDSPAYRAGLMPEDRVLEIDGKSTQGKSVDECISLLVGEPKTTVKLLIDRKGEKLTVELVREKIKTRSVKGFHRDDADATTWQYMIDPARSIAYIRLSQFTPQCAAEIAAALKSVNAESGGVKGLILDLRFNPGGLLDEACEIADMFLKEGVIVSTKGRAHKEVITRATGPGTLPEFPMVVLVNGQSASASEVLSGALVENNRAKVIGTRSFGKGSVQSVHPIEGGAAGELKITEQGYYLPSGRSITRKDESSEWGVDPSDGFFVPMTDQESADMIRARREEEIIKVGKSHPSLSNWSDPDWIVSQLKDPQLGAAVKALQKKIDGGEWVPTGQPNQAGKAIAAAELSKTRDLARRLSRTMLNVQKRIDALEKASGDETKPADLWPDGIEIAGGRVKIYDKEGKLVRELEITGPSLEEWLVDADVKALGEAPAAPEKKSTASKDAEKKDGEPAKTPEPSK
ncbi:MAG: S41 family peptidase [Planctomycetota bacterium]|nr:S41 family peptidase [Planctomycetota bacterium]